jgi:hypothetical protein
MKEESEKYKETLIFKILGNKGYGPKPKVHHPLQEAKTCNTRKTLAY